jgi:hypothetical protein
VGPEERRGKGVRGGSQVNLSIAIVTPEEMALDILD